MTAPTGSPTTIDGIPKSAVGLRVALRRAAAARLAALDVDVEVAGAIDLPGVLRARPGSRRSRVGALGPPRTVRAC